MPSVSQRQRRFFGAVMGAKKGRKVGGHAGEVAQHMNKDTVKHFLKTSYEAGHANVMARYTDKQAAGASIGPEIRDIIAAFRAGGLLGAAPGAVVGAATAPSGHRGKGALIGAGSGYLGGGLLGTGGAAAGLAHALHLAKAQEAAARLAGKQLSHAGNEGPIVGALAGGLGGSVVGGAAGGAVSGGISRRHHRKEHPLHTQKHAAAIPGAQQGETLIEKLMAALKRYHGNLTGSTVQNIREFRTGPTTAEHALPALAKGEEEAVKARNLTRGITAGVGAAGLGGAALLSGDDEAAQHPVRYAVEHSRFGRSRLGGLLGISKQR